MATDKAARGAKLQVALDFVNLPRAMKAAEAAVRGGAEILEAGTPLIKAEGLDAVRELRTKFPDLRITSQYVNESGYVCTHYPRDFGYAGR